MNNSHSENNFKHNSNHSLDLGDEMDMLSILFISIQSIKSEKHDLYIPLDELDNSKLWS